jgi:hypothetical protein
MFANLLEPLLSSIIRVPKACCKTNKRRDEGKSGKGRRKTQSNPLGPSFLSSEAKRYPLLIIVVFST